MSELTNDNFNDVIKHYSDYKLPIQMNLQLFAEDSGEKTEKPTPRKLKKAKEEGRVFKSSDFNNAIALLVGMVAIRYIGPSISKQMVDIFRAMYSNHALYDLEDKDITYMISNFSIEFLKILLSFAGIMFIVSIVSNVAQVGFMYSTKSLIPDFKKLNPVEGMKRIFSKRGLLELVKFLFKFVAVLGVVWMDFRDSLVEFNNLILLNFEAGLKIGTNKIMSIFLKISGLLLVFSFIDYFLQRRFYMKDMMMTKREIKEEYKTVEGDPLIKGKLREKQRQISMNQVMSEASKATVVVTNPTHIAVCLKYEEDMSLPVVIAMGRDLIAQKIKEVARENDIPVIEDKPLARGLYNNAEVGEKVPEEYLRAVAKIIAYVMSLKE